MLRGVQRPESFQLGWQGMCTKKLGLGTVCMQICPEVLLLKVGLRMGREGYGSCPLTPVPWRRKSGNVNMY